jgi:hypothetical protein
MGVITDLGTQLKFIFENKNFDGSLGPLSSYDVFP